MKKGGGYGSFPNCINLKEQENSVSLLQIKNQGTKNKSLSLGANLNFQRQLSKTSLKIYEPRGLSRGHCGRSGRQEIHGGFWRVLTYMHEICFLLHTTNFDKKFSGFTCNDTQNPDLDMFSRFWTFIKLFIFANTLVLGY